MTEQTMEQSPVEGAQEQARLSQVRSDVLALVDVVSGFSDAARLATREELFAEFVRQAPQIEQPRVADLKEQIDATVAEVTGKEEKRTLTVHDRIPPV